MSREQLLSNLGTIARSGTRKFMEMMKDKAGDNNLIGQVCVTHTRTHIRTHVRTHT